MDPCNDKKGIRPSQEPRSAVKSVLLVAICTIGQIMNIANSTFVSVSLPTIGRSLQITEAELQWLVSAYSLSAACLLLPFGRVADLYGRKRVYLAGCAWLVTFGIGCSFANDALTLQILRGLQGVGGSAIIPASLGILARRFPPSPARSIAFATFSAGAPVGGATGVLLGAVLVQLTIKTWRSPFYLSAGLAAFCLIGGLLVIDPDEHVNQDVDRHVDWAGSFLVTAGLVLIIFVLGQGENAPKQWATPYIIALLIVGVFLVVVFVFWQRYLEHLHDLPKLPRSRLTPPPIMKPTLWKRSHWRYAGMMTIVLFNWCGFMGYQFWAMLYYQEYMGLTPIDTALRLLPQFISGILCNVFVAFVVGRLPVVYLLAGGTLTTSIGPLLFALIEPEVTYWAFGFPSATLGVIGADFVFAAGTIFIAKVSLPHEQSVSGGLFQTMIQLGTAIGVTITTIVYDRVLRQGDSLKAYHATQWTSFAFVIAATIIGIILFPGVGVVGGKKSQQQDNHDKDKDEASVRTVIVSDV
ncbi:major facilitator superfamily MFS-1 [Fistulina hepatica ATCC 64428]|uniref:Major facilitator superfamily MFS-1 n=1 Tax=Fistulina hepatica ATCC 64428 TaxID=1128425 RepID=A0A0D7AFV0_9AGAR|nr:major facilitator superfamily MFS-1 [Fistulina hepatica ATCC 64428]